MPETVVRLIKNWAWPDWRRMTPKQSGVWGTVRFIETDDAAFVDYVLILNQPHGVERVRVPRNRIWTLVQEPPDPYHAHLHVGQRVSARIYTSDPHLPVKHPRYVFSHPGLPWHVERSFDQLVDASPPQKNRDISWITSSVAFLPGHRSRMKYLERIKRSGVVDVFGRQIRPVADKWDALAPYRYAIVFENFSGPGYWTEKLADCFLAGTMPIYFGCTNIADYFPPEAIIRLDPDHPDPVRFLREVAASDRFEHAQPGIIEARRRCLYEHHFLAHMAREIAGDDAPPEAVRQMRLAPRYDWNPVRAMKSVWHYKISPAFGNRYSAR